MKNIIAMTILINLTSFSCKKDSKPTLPSTINVAGTIIDKLTGNALDSVSVTLEYNDGTMGGYNIPQSFILTSSTGKYDFQFSTKRNYSYQLTFDKLHYQWTSRFIDLTKGYQVINVVLSK